jgi:hypothetical protein
VRRPWLASRAGSSERIEPSAPPPGRRSRTRSIIEVEGVAPEYRAAAIRYFGQEQGNGWCDGLPAGMNMTRIAVRPTVVHVLDFETRFPSALSA